MDDLISARPGSQDAHLTCEPGSVQAEVHPNGREVEGMKTLSLRSGSPALGFSGGKHLFRSWLPRVRGALFRSLRSRVNASGDNPAT